MVLHVLSVLNDDGEDLCNAFLSESHMHDDVNTINDYKSVIQKFIEQHGWTEHHSAKSLTIHIAVKAARLLEQVILLNEQQAEVKFSAKSQEVTHQIIDVFFEILLLSIRYEIDIVEAFNRKMIKNAQKYPCISVSMPLAMHQASTLNDYKRVVQHFIDSRGWDKKHSAKNLAMNIFLEAAELLEHASFITQQQADEKFAAKPQEVTDEIVDVFFALLAFCIQYDIDLAQAFDQKMMTMCKDIL